MLNAIQGTLIHLTYQLDESMINMRQDPHVPQRIAPVNVLIGSDRTLSKYLLNSLSCSVLTLNLDWMLYPGSRQGEISTL